LLTSSAYFFYLSAAEHSPPAGHRLPVVYLVAVPFSYSMFKDIDTHFGNGYWSLIVIFEA